MEPFEIGDNMKCRECNHYMIVDSTKGSCFGTEITGDADPQYNKKCRGKYFKPRYARCDEDKNKKKQA